MTIRDLLNLLIASNNLDDVVEFRSLKTNKILDKALIRYTKKDKIIIYLKERGLKKWK